MRGTVAGDVPIHDRREHYLCIIHMRGIYGTRVSDKERELACRYVMSRKKNLRGNLYLILRVMNR